MYYKCKLCGGDIEVAEKVSVAQCPYCKTTQTFPIVDDETKSVLFNRADDLRRACDFDKAAEVYERLIEEGCEDGEAYWGLVLCKFGIEFVENASHKMTPTCHRVQLESLSGDIDFKNACKNSDIYRQTEYINMANEIAVKQRTILELVKNEEPYDVFISFKQTDSYGQVTKDYVAANGIYQHLTKQGFRVFFSPVTLLDHAGEDYEPFIFAALNSAKAMVVVGTSTENINAKWVHNEWGRYFKLCRNDKTRILIVCYREMKASQLPAEFANLEALDMNNVGFLEPLTKRIQEYANPHGGQQVANKTIAPDNDSSEANINTKSLLKRAFMYLEDKDWYNANQYCEKVLDADPECANAYLGKLMSELQVSKKEDLKNLAEPFDSNNNFNKTVRFGDDDLKAELNGYIDYINERNERNRIEKDKQARETQIAQNKIKEDEKKEVDFIFVRLVEALEDGNVTEETQIRLNQSKEKMAELDKTLQIQISSFKTTSVLSTADALSIEKVREKIESVYSKINQIGEEIKAAEKQRDSLSFISVSQKLDLTSKIKLLTLSKAQCDDDIELGRQIIETMNEQYILSLEIDYLTAKLALENDKNTKKLTIDEIVNEIETKKHIFVALSSDPGKRELLSHFIKMPLEIRILLDIPISFGKYPQGKYGEKESIKWKYLTDSNGKVLLISEKGLAFMKFNEEHKETTWNTSSLRKWLNKDFIRTSFSENEKDRIVMSLIPADKNPEHKKTKVGFPTMDKVFLLSLPELETYFPSVEERKCKVNENIKPCGFGYGWWLRTPGGDQYHALFVRDDGSLDYYGNGVNNARYIRPVMWIQES